VKDLIEDLTEAITDSPLLTMKVDSFRRCYGNNLEGKWDWSVPVWFGKGIFADLVLTSRKKFDTKQECLDDMERVIKKMKLTTKKHT
jgi:hypothetical protein